MAEELKTGAMSVFADIAWGQWISSGFLLLLGIVLASFAARSVSKVMAKRSSRHHTVMVRRLVFYIIFLLFGVAALRVFLPSPSVLRHKRPPPT